MADTYQQFEDAMIETFLVDPGFTTLPEPVYLPGSPEYDLTLELIRKIANPVDEHIRSFALDPVTIEQTNKVQMTVDDPLAGYLGAKIDDVTIKYNESTLKLYVNAVPVAEVDKLGGVQIGAQPFLYMQGHNLMLNAETSGLLVGGHNMVPTSRAVKLYVDSVVTGGGGGGGDMLKTTYDTNTNGVVDDSERLNNQVGSYYLSWANFTGTPNTLALYGITDAYTVSEIDAFFEGEDSGKKQVDWARIISKPDLYTVQNQGNNRVITSSDTGYDLWAEPNLLFTGSLLTVTGDANISGILTVLGLGTGDLDEIDAYFGDAVTTPTYGMIAVGSGVMGRTSHTAGDGAPAYNLDGAFIFQNSAGPVTGDIEFGFLDSSGLLRFGLPKSAIGNATYNPRSIIIAGPAIADSDVVTLSYWQTQGIFDNLVMDTAGSGADLGVQNDLEVEGDIFTDSVLESTTDAGVTIESLKIEDGTLYTTVTDMTFQDGSVGPYTLTQLAAGGSDGVLTAVTATDITAVDFTITGGSDVLDIDFGHNFTVHDDVTLTSLATDDIMKWNGSAWINVPIPTGGGSHGFLSGTHTDTETAAPVRGDIITAQTATPEWRALAKGTNTYILKMGADEPAWGQVDWSELTGSQPAPISHTLLSHTIAGETLGHVLAADSATTYSIRELLGSEINNDQGWTNNTSDVSVTNQGDNRIVTSTGTTDVLNAESTLTWNGTNLTFNGGAILYNFVGQLRTDDIFWVTSPMIGIQNVDDAELRLFSDSDNTGIGRSIVSMYDESLLIWQYGKYTDNSFGLYDVQGIGNHVFEVLSGGDMSFQPDGVINVKKTMVMSNGVVLGTIATNSFSLGAYDAGVGYDLFITFTAGATPSWSFPQSGGGTTNFLNADGGWTVPAGSGVTAHSALTELDYASADHTGFEPTLTKGNLTELTSSVLTIGSGTGAVIGSGTTILVKQASTSVSGYLSNTDWDTFNNKISMVYPAGSGIPIVVSGTSWGTTITDNSSTWDAAQPGHANLTSLAGLSFSSTSFVKMTSANTFALDTNTYDPSGTAAGLISTHESTYDHDAYDTHVGATSGNPHQVTYAELGGSHPAPVSHTLLSHTIAGETLGHVLAADSATTYSIRQLLGSEINNDQGWGTGGSDVSVANQGDNRIVTATASTDALNAEANLTFDGTDLAIAATGKIYFDGGTDTYISEVSTGDVRMFVDTNDIFRVTSTLFGIGYNSGVDEWLFYFNGSNTFTFKNSGGDYGFNIITNSNTIQSSGGTARDFILSDIGGAWMTAEAANKTHVTIHRILAVDNIEEETGAAGVTIEGVQFIDSDIILTATEKLYFDGGAGLNTFMNITGGDTLQFSVEGNAIIKATASEVLISSASATNLLKIQDTSAGTDFITIGHDNTNAVLDVGATSIGYDIKGAGNLWMSIRGASTDYFHTADSATGYINDYYHERTTGQTATNLDYIYTQKGYFYNNNGTPELIEATRIAHRVMDVNDATEDAEIQIWVRSVGSLVEHATIGANVFEIKPGVLFYARGNVYTDTLYGYGATEVIVEADLIFATGHEIQMVAGTNEHLFISAGNFSGATDSGGDLYLQAGDAGASSSDGGDILLVPGNDNSVIGYVYIGDGSSTHTTSYIQAAGSPTNITLVVAAKGTGFAQLGSVTNYAIVRGSTVALQSSNISLGANLGDVDMFVATPGSGAGYDLTVRAGDASSGDTAGGDLFMYPGALSGAGADGQIYFGTGAAGWLNAKGAETNVVFYNTSTGLLTYGTELGGGDVTANNYTQYDLAIWDSGTKVLTDTAGNLSFDGTNLKAITYIDVQAGITNTTGDININAEDTYDAALNAGFSSAGTAGDARVSAGDTTSGSEGYIIFQTGSDPYNQTATKANILYYDTATGYVTYGAAPSGVTAHSALTELDYASAGHTGFMASSAHPHSAFNRASSVLSGANVFSNIVVTAGIVTAIATRGITTGDIGAEPANSNFTYVTTTPSINYVTVFRGGKEIGLPSASVNFNTRNITSLGNINGRFKTATGINVYGTLLFTDSGLVTSTAGFIGGTSLTLTGTSSGVTLNGATGVALQDSGTNVLLCVTDLSSFTGAVTATGDITGNTSDIRLKTNIVPIYNALDKLISLIGFTYNFNDLARGLNPVFGGGSQVGLSAQDVQKVLSEAVRPAPFDYHEGKSISGEDYLTIQYEKMVPLIIQGVKELKSEKDLEIEAHEKRIAELEREVELLKQAA